MTRFAAPSGIQKILPGFRRVFFRNDFRIVSDHRKRRPHAIVKAGLILKTVGKTGDALGGKFQQQPFVLQKLEVAGIRSMNHVGILYSRRSFLHESLQHTLRAVAVHFHFDAFIFVLKIVRDGGGRWQRQRGMPHHLSLFARGLNQLRHLAPRRRKPKSSPWRAASKIFLFSWSFPP